MRRRCVTLINEKRDFAFGKKNSCWDWAKKRRLKVSENDVQILKTEFQGLEKRLIEWFDRVDKDIAEVKDRLKAIEKELHGPGNGKPGISIRLDRLEKAKHAALWIIRALTTALVIGLITHYFSLIEKLISK